VATDVIKQIVELNHLCFGNGDEYNSADLVRSGVEAGTLVALTEPRRPSSIRPVIGYCLIKIDKRVLRLERIAVAPKHRNGGYGKDLIARAMRWRDLNCPAVPLFTYISAENLSSINAHVHAGFGLEAIGRDWVYVMG